MNLDVARSILFLANKRGRTKPSPHAWTMRAFWALLIALGAWSTLQE